MGCKNLNEPKLENLLKIWMKVNSKNANSCKKCKRWEEPQKLALGQIIKKNPKNHLDIPWPWEHLYVAHIFIQSFLEKWKDILTFKTIVPFEKEQNLVIGKKLKNK
jgi:hypothetical protein